MKKLHLGNQNAYLPYAKMKSIMVEGYFSELQSNPKNFKEGCGYVYKDLVFIWFDDAPRRCTLPYITYNPEKKKYLIHVNHISDDMREDFSVNNIRDLSREHLEETISENEELYDEEELRYMNSSQTVYTPEIGKDDDFLKMLVKKLLLVMHININQFTPKFAMKHTLTNMKTALQKKTKTSTTVFSKWMELFETEFVIGVKLKKPSKEMDGYVLYTSKDNNVRYVDKKEADETGWKISLK